MTRRVVVVGCGSMAPAWLDVLVARDDVEIVGLVDVVPEAASRLRAHYALDCAVHSDLDTALAGTSADIVIDVTVPDAHPAVTHTALAAGAHVLGEKPMCTTLADAQEMVRAAARAERRYSVMQNRRFDGGLRALHDVVGSGALGTVAIVGADFFLAPHFGGFRDQMASPLLVDMAVHTFDQARFITGCDAVEVFCREVNPAGSWYAGAAAALCLFTMSDGSLFSYRGSWCAPGHATSWQASWRVSGTEGAACWDGETEPVVETTRPGDDGFFHAVDRRVVPITWPGRTGHAGCIDEMLEALDDDRPAETDAADNIRSVAMVFAALESARTGAPVPVRW